MTEIRRYRRNLISTAQKPANAGEEGQKPVLLLLSATIAPPSGVPNLRRTDVRSRREDYREALRFYLTRPSTIIDRIVLLENSDSDLDDLQSVAEEYGAGKDVELVSFYGLDYPPKCGRGYGEFKMIDVGFKCSDLLGALGERDVFWKSTGRLKVLNIERLIQAAPETYDVLCDFRRWPQRAVDWRIMSCTRRGYERVYFDKYREFCEDSLKMSGEAYDFARLEPVYYESGIVPRFPIQPLIAGISGEHNVDYYSRKNRIKHWVRVMARRLVPRLWI